MTFRVRLSLKAQRDRDLVLAWYDVEAPDQSELFIDEFYAMARRLEDYPHAGAVVRDGARRISLQVFPYQLWYRVHDQARVVEIIALLHHRRDPESLSERLELGAD